MAFPAISDTDFTTYIRTLINEPNALYVTDAQIVQWIDRATQVIAQLAFAMEDDTVIEQLATGQTEYSLTTAGITDEQKIEAILYQGQFAAAPNESEIKNGEAVMQMLVKIHPRQMEHIQVGTAGPPKFWTLINRTIIIEPAPSADENTDSVRILYYKNINDTPTNLPDHLQEYVIWYAVSKYFSRAGKPQQAAQYMSYFNNFLMFHRADRHYKASDSKDMMGIQDMARQAG